MAQDISLLGAVYSDVPSVLLPKQGGGTAQFDDTTDADATASDILSGKTAYVNGVKITGTGTGGGGSVTQDQDGFIVLPTTGGGGGGGGLEYESGTWTPTEDIARGTITFTNAHTEPPLFIMLTDDDVNTPSANSNIAFSYVDHYRQVGHGIGSRYGYIGYMYAPSGGGISSSTQIFSTSSDSGLDSLGTYANYYAKSTAFYPSSNSTTRLWRANHNYKWIAVWKPTT